jgi:hypothetical protein
VLSLRGGVGGGGGGMGQMAPHYVRLMSFLLAIFEGRVAVILMAGNWEVK